MAVAKMSVKDFKYIEMLYNQMDSLDIGGDVIELYSSYSTATHFLCNIQRSNVLCIDSFIEPKIYLKFISTLEGLTKCNYQIFKESPSVFLNKYKGVCKFCFITGNDELTEEDLLLIKKKMNHNTTIILFNYLTNRNSYNLFNKVFNKVYSDNELAWTYIFGYDGYNF